MTKKIIFQIVCVIALLISHFNLSYNFNEAWWHSAFGFCVILLFGSLIWGGSFPFVSGLRMEASVIARSAGLAIGITVISFYCMWLIGKSSHITIHLSSIKSYFHNAVYIVNEEIILGSMMLYFMTNRFKVKRLVASLSLAVVVSAAHFILYKFYFRDKGNLEITTLLTLVLTVFVKNNLIIRYRHIGYAWALHFGWMVVMYGSDHFYSSGRRLTDLEKFNLYLGSPVVVIVSALMATVSYYYLDIQLRKRKEIIDGAVS